MKMVKRIFGMVMLAGGLFAGLAGCTSGGTDPYMFTSDPGLGNIGSLSGDSTNSGGGSGDVNTKRFEVGDQVSITFIPPDTGTQVIPQHEERIKDDGTITLTLVGAVKAAGKTAGELQREVHDLYVPKYYKRLTVIVKTQDLFYYVGGEVKQPNRQPYLGRITLTKAIQTAGDFNDWANRKKITLTRANGTVIKVNWTKAIENPTLDPEVYPGDKIYVPRHW